MDTKARGERVKIRLGKKKSQLLKSFKTERKKERRGKLIVKYGYVLMELCSYGIRSLYIHKNKIKMFKN